MALTAEEEQKIRALLAKEEAQKKKSILQSKDNLKTWLKQVAFWLLEKLTDKAMDILFSYLLG
ncbi:hypothetical protein [Microcoleus sp. B4-C1]|uniref:hypothetical protein n=2 Tax=Microcoleus TaxID=44471 RepID=UPI002FD62DF9